MELLVKVTRCDKKKRRQYTADMCKKLVTNRDKFFRNLMKDNRLYFKYIFVAFI